MLDAASRGVKANVRAANERSSTPPTPADEGGSLNTGGGSTGRTAADKERRSEAPDAEDGSSSSSSGGGGARIGEGSGPDPFDRIESVALTSLAGSLKILSAAVGGIGDAVFQAGVLAEGLAGGTGQVAGENRDATRVGLKRTVQHQRKTNIYHPQYGVSGKLTPPYM